MDIEIFSDVVCPWSAIGRHRFEVALGEFSHADEVEVTWKAFELDPSTPVGSHIDVAAHLAEKYNMTRKEALAAQEKLAATAATEGLTFRFEQTKRANTFDAHRLLHYAHEVGLQDALKGRLFAAYFTDGEAIDDHETLIRLGVEVGLDATTLSEILSSDRYATEVRADELEAKELGISGVPFFVIDRQFGISGAQSPQTILQVLNDAWEKTHPLVVTPGDEAVACTNDSCAI